MIGSRRVAASLLATMLVASACGSPSDDEESAANDLPPAPAVRELRDTEPVVADDGLLRVVVTIPNAMLGLSDDSDSTDSTMSDTSTPLEAFRSKDGILTLKVDEMAQFTVPPGSTLVMQGGVLGYLDEDGVFEPLPLSQQPDPSAFQPPAPPPSPFLNAESVAGVLAALPGVEEVDEITHSSYAVTATSLDSIETLGLEIAEDAALALTTDPYEPYQWALENAGDNLSAAGLAQIPAQSPDADADGAEASDEATGRGVVVAVVDSGVDFSHADLSGAAWVNPNEDCGGGTPNGIDDDRNGFIDDCAGWDFGDGDPVTFDGRNDEHGTHVAGIIAARSGNGIGMAGVAPDAQIMDLRVDDSFGRISSSTIARAIRYAVDNGADVINLSLGTTPGTPRSSVSHLEEAVDYAGSKGVLLVAAAGNNSISLDTSPVYPASFDSEHMLVVGASTPSDRSASFSNRGAAIDLFAPGELILSTVPNDQLAFMSGTSQASPMVAATAALVLESNSGISPSSVVDRVVGSADGLDSLNALAENPVRLNSARAVGLEPDVPGVDDVVTIRGLGADADGAVSATISIGEVGGQFNQPFHWEASLLAIVDGSPFAIVEHPVAVQDAAGADVRSASTDGRGAVLLAEKGVQLTTWSTTLPPGSYALMVEAVPRTDSTARLGDGFLARFDVGAEQGASSGSDTPGSTSTDPDSGSGSGTDNSSGEGNNAPTGGTGSTTTDNPASGSETPGENSANEPSDGRDDETTNNSSGEPNDQTQNDGENEPSSSGGQTPGTTGSGEGTNAGSGSSDTGDEASSTQPGEQNSGGSDAESAGDPTGAGGGQVDEPMELGPDQGSSGDWAITSVSPQIGVVGVENTVELTGEFPESPVVWFGDTASETLFEDEDRIVVRTRRNDIAETVDVTLRTNADGDVLTLPDAFAFVLADGETSSGTGSGSTGGSSTDTGSGSTGGSSTGGNDSSTGGSEEAGQSGETGNPDIDGSPNDGIVVDDAPPPSPDDGSTDDETPRSRNRQSRANIDGEPRQLPNGLTGVPLSGLATVGGVPACDEALCRTRRV